MFLPSEVDRDGPLDVSASAILPQFEDNQTLRGHCTVRSLRVAPMSAAGRLCCKSRFALRSKILRATGAAFV